MEKNKRSNHKSQSNGKMEFEHVKLAALEKDPEGKQLLDSANDLIGLIQKLQEEMDPIEEKLKPMREKMKVFTETKREIQSKLDFRWKQLSGPRNLSEPERRKMIGMFDKIYTLQRGVRNRTPAHMSSSTPRFEHIQFLLGDWWDEKDSAARDVLWVEIEKTADMFGEYVENLKSEE